MIMCRGGIFAALFAASGSGFVAEAREAIGLEALYVGEAWRNTQGGLRTGSKFLGVLDVGATLDAERLCGLQGTEIFANALLIHGGTLSGRLLGDVQTASNIEAASQTRLFELWLEKTFGHSGAHSLRVGLYDLNSEFDASETSSLFVNSSHGIGPQIAQTGRNGPSIFPVTSFGARMRWTLTSAWAAQVAVLDGVPGDPNNPTSNTLRFGSDDGVLIVTEVSRAAGRFRKAALGAWTYTSEFEEIVKADFAGDVQHRNDNRGLYLLLDVQLLAERDDLVQGLSAFLRAGTANHRINRFDDYFGAGVVYTGVLPQRRREDQLGVALASVGNGRTYRRFNDTNAREDVIELTYRFPVSDWLSLQGIIQHIVNPGLHPAIEDATAFAIRFELAARL